MTKRHLKGFTIIELAVTLLLSAIVLSITAAVVASVSKTYAAMKRTSACLNELQKINETADNYIKAYDTYDRFYNVSASGNGLIANSILATPPQSYTINLAIDYEYIKSATFSAYNESCVVLSVAYESMKFYNSSSDDGESKYEYIQFYYHLDEARING